MIDAALLTRPIREIQRATGEGILPGGDPARAHLAGDDPLALALPLISEVLALAPQIVAVLDRVWQGGGSALAAETLTSAGDGLSRLVGQGEEIGVLSGQALAIVQRCHAELTAIAASCASALTGAAPLLATPAGIGVVLGIASEHLGRAVATVARAQGELAAPTSRLATIAAEVVPTPRLPDVGQALRALGTAIPGPGGPGLGGNGGPGPGMNALGLFDGPPLAPEITARSGDGVEVMLPGGGVALAPNERAADAVRNALSAVGTPYVWGGTTPGAGLDCSGLTQWAYGEAGVELPRLAQEQHLGHPRVAPDALMPGDLAVWDGHVAMVIGNGMMVEAGDPVSVSPIRTDNIGMGFYGFYRPTGD